MLIIRVFDEILLHLRLIIKANFRLSVELTSCAGPSSRTKQEAPALQRIAFDSRRLFFPQRLQTLSGIHKLCSAIDRAHSANPLQEGLSLDVAVLEGAEADPSRHDHCGALYPVNTLRNLALLQVRVYMLLTSNCS